MIPPSSGDRERRTPIKMVCATTVSLFLAFLCAACSKAIERPAVCVPPDCQQFLGKYFAAVKSKDIPTLQDICYCLSNADRSKLPEGSLEMMRESRKKLVADFFGHAATEFGDFKGYTVVSVKVTTVFLQDQLAANVMGAGVHAEIVCKAKFSKKRDARVGLHLFKEDDGSDYCVAAWNYEAAL
jgi:hypothetical protein